MRGNRENFSVCAFRNLDLGTGESTLRFRRERGAVSGLARTQLVSVSEDAILCQMRWIGFERGTRKQSLSEGDSCACPATNRFDRRCGLRIKNDVQ